MLVTGSGGVGDGGGRLSRLEFECSQVYSHCWYIEPRNREKVLGSFDNVFHVYLMNGLQKYQKKIFHGGFLR